MSEVREGLEYSLGEGYYYKVKIMINGKVARGQSFPGWCFAVKAEALPNRTGVL